MPQGKHPESPKLRQAQASSHDYGYDVGYLHRGDYALLISGHFTLLRPERPLRPQRIGRYLDGEEEREGLYR